MGLLGYLLHWQVVGHIFTSMVAIASSIAIAGFCIGCFLHFQLKQWQYRRSLKIFLKSKNYKIMIDILIDNDYHYRIKIIPPLQYSVERMNFSYFSPEVC